MRDLEDERLFAIAVTQDNPKSYQVWHHRQWITERLHCHQSELDSVSLLLLMGDAKNHSAWVHRQWVAEELLKATDDKTGTLDLEYDFMNTLLEADCFNHSVWAYRAWLTDLSVNQGWEQSDEAWQRECSVAAKWLAVDACNTSVWYYIEHLRLRGFSPELEEAVSRVKDIKDVAFT